MKALTPKQRLFVAEYLTDLNATRAAIAAGYSERTARQQGSRLLINVDISDAIAQKHGKKLAKLEITTERVLAEIAKIAFLDPRQMFNSDGSPKQILDLDDDTAAAVAGLEVCELFEGNGEQKHAYGLIKKVKMADKLKALELYGRYQKLFTDKVEQTGADGGPIVIKVDI